MLITDEKFYCEELDKSIPALSDIDVTFKEKGALAAEKQLADYLDSYGLKKGYMLTFNFNKEKEVGVKEVRYEGKILIEAVV